MLVPGIQGRWEWMRPTVDALAARCRVITFSLADEPSSGGRFDEAAGFDSYIRQIRDAMDSTGVQRAVVCGVSYGGLIAASFAARHPDRTSGLILSSAIPPSWTPDQRTRFLMKAPRLLSPVFCVGSLRLFPEMVVAKEGVGAGLLFALRHVANVAAHPFTARLMARRVRLIAGLDLAARLAELRVPTLVITGEPALDRVVPVRATREYLRLWAHASQATVARTGHLGLITRPDQFADLVAGFAARVAGIEQERRDVV